jgi:hypothetical protein
MTYEELKKQAIPGRMKFDGFGGVEIGDDAVFGIASAGTDPQQDDATARLFSHCVNNFDTALEALKRVAAYGNEGRSLNPYELRAFLNQTIAELETVERV